MRREALLFSISIFTFLIFQASCLAFETLPSPDPQNLRLIQYSFTLQNTGSAVIPDAQLWVYAPVKGSSFQKSINLKVSHPYELLQDRTGNQILHFSLADFPPFATRIISVQAQLELLSQPLAASHPDLEQYLRPQKYIESDHPEILRLAKELRGDNPDETVRNIFQWVSTSITYAGYLQDYRGALYALRNRKGDCTEFMSLFVALCRANGIPARGLGGYVYDKDSMLQAAEYHNWAEFYHEGAWRVADAQKKVLMENETAYIAMNVIGEMPDNPMADSQRFRLEGKGLLVKMNGDR